MKQFFLWFFRRRWMIKKAVCSMNKQQRQQLLANITLVKMIPDTGIIQSDAVFICLLHERKFNRKKFMQGWRWGKRCVTDMLHIGAHMVLDATEKSRSENDYDSFDQGAELAVEQFYNMMVSRGY